MWLATTARPGRPPPSGGRLNLPLPQPELYNLETDPEESYDVASDHPDVVAAIRARIDALLPTFPNEVRNAWQDTLNNPVGYTPPGALPSLRNP